MLDQLARLENVLENQVPVLVYHGNFDLILPVHGMANALKNTKWSKRHVAYVQFTFVDFI